MMRYFMMNWIVIITTVMGTMLLGEATFAQEAKSISVDMEGMTLQDLAVELSAELGIPVSVTGPWETKLRGVAMGITKDSGLALLRSKAETVGATVVDNGGVYEVTSKLARIDEVPYYSKKPYARRGTPEGEPEKKSYIKDILFRPFLPKTRYYFDTGTDDEGEVDIFRDGGIAPAIDFINFYMPLNIHPNKSIGKFMGDDWLLGPSFGLGITTPADPDSDDSAMSGDDSSSSAPVIVASIALELDIPIGRRDRSGLRVDSNYISVEAGLARGWSTDEGFDDINDSAFFIGLGYSWKQDSIKPNK
jgi:hypothetical protein